MSCTPTPGAPISVPYANDKTWPIRATKPDGTSKDLTGYTLILTVAEDVSTDSPYLLQKTAVLDTPTQPVKGTLTLTADDLTITPGKYRYDKALFKDGLKQSSQVGDFTITPVVNTDTTP